MGNNLVGKILIVDDQPENLKVLGTFLQGYGHEIHIARDGKTAINAISLSKPDLILLDILMPNMDGYELCKILKADENTKDIPVIFLSALHSVENKLKAFQSGGIDYIEKPFIEEEVLSRVNTHLSLSKQKELLKQKVDEKTMELQEKNEKLEEAQRIAKLGQWSLNFETDELKWSDEIYRIFELDKNKFTPSYENFLNTIHPEDRDMVNEAYTKSLENKEPYHIVHRLLMKDGSIKWVRENCNTSFNEDGKPLISIGTVQDITKEYLKNELLKKKDRLLAKQERTAALGEMMDAIAHQWKQPLSAISMIMSNSQLNIELEEEITKEQMCTMNNEITKQIEHLTTTIDEFREFFRADRPKELYNLKDIITSTLKLEKSHINKNKVTIEMNIDNEDINLYCIKTEFKHVLINLINNSIDAFNQNKIEKRTISFTASEKNNEVILEICDNAGGIDEDVLPKIFKSNYTTKEEGKGTGIGLYLVKQIIEKANGTIEAYNVNDGVCFKITTPLN